MNVIGNALEELYRIFDILNDDKFDGALPEPVITIYKTRGRTLGHFTCEKTWRDKNDVDNEETSYYEINIDPRWFCNRTPEEVVETLLHEMCHYANKIDGVKDCNGNIHNKKFKKLAERVGLIVEKGKSVGWGYTSLSDELMEYIKEEINPDETAFEYFRAGAKKPDDTKKPRKKNMFAYTCPDCGQTVKGKRDITVKCGVCENIMDMEDVEEDNDDNDDTDDVNDNNED